jgi:chromosome segregation ATPase
MKKFRNTQYTYNKLLEEIEFLKKQTITFNADYNKSKDMYNESKSELESLRVQINKEFHENKVNISNHNKDFIDNLNNKEKQLENLQYTLSQKEIDIKCNNDRLETFQIELQKLEKKLTSKEIELNKKEKSISMQNKKLNERLLEMCQKEDRFTKDIR